MKKSSYIKFNLTLLFVALLAIKGYSQLSTITPWNNSGVNPVFNRATNTVTYTKADSAGTYHIYISDSLGNNEKRLTYAGWGSNRHQFVEEIDPTGQYFICYVEKPDTNTLEWFYTFHTRTHEDATPGYGWYTDIWVLKSDGSQAWQLTNLLNDYTTGVLHGALSEDGSVFAWTERITAGNIFDFNLFFGETVFRVANLVLTPTPHFEDIHTFQPGGVAACGEIESISNDKKTLAFYSTFETKNVLTTPIYIMDTITKVPIRLSDGVASQCPTFTPDNKHIIYMSANGCDRFPNQVMLGADWYITNLDGSDTRRITYMNVTNNPQSVNDYRLAGTLTFLSNTSFLGGVLTNPSGAIGYTVKVDFDQLMTGVENKTPENLPDLFVYPAVASDFLNVTIEDNPGKLSYTIFNVVGIAVAEGEVEGNTSQIDVSNYANGMYFLKLSNGKMENIKKFLVEK